jgi:acetyl-CoA C-acetyltransferase
MESMTRAPYILPGARAGYRMGNNEIIDSMINDGLWCAFDAVHMGSGTEKYVTDTGDITRAQQDELAAKSHERAAAAQKEGRFADEIAPVSIPQRKGDPIVVDADEGVRPGTTTESLGALRAAFSKEGTITAGNASQISDGAAVIIVMSPAKAEELGADAAAELLGYGWSPVRTSRAPAVAPIKRIDSLDLTVSDIDLFELNGAAGPRR